MSGLWHKINRKWVKLRLQPIRVFCLHHVCKAFDAESMNKGDWMQIDEFKQKVQTLQQLIMLNLQTTMMLLNMLRKKAHR